MTDPTTTDAGPRYAFAPHPDPIEDVLYRIRVVVEEPDGRLWSAGTDLMAPSMESAEVAAEDLNSRLRLDYATWTEFARRVFSASRELDKGHDSGPPGPAN